MGSKLAKSKAMELVLFAFWHVQAAFSYTSIRVVEKSVEAGVDATYSS